MNERIKELRAKAQKLAAEAFPSDVPFDPNPDPILWDRIHLSYEKFAELIICDFISNCERLADQAANRDEDGLDGLIGSGWDDGWISCAERLTEIVATEYNINHKSFTGYDPKKPFFRS